MLAIVQIAGKQYPVKSKDIIQVDKLPFDEGKIIPLEEILLIQDDKGVTHLGFPFLKDFSIKAKVISHIKGEKIEVRRYKSKVRYRKHIGFRPQYTKLEII